MQRFTHEPLWQIRNWLQERLVNASPGDILNFQAPNPDLGSGLYAGEALEKSGWLHRGHRAWMDLAETLGLRFLTPEICAEDLVCFRFQVLDPTNSWHHLEVADARNKYDPSRGYGRLNKLEEPWFLHDYLAALSRIKPPPQARVLDLGINSGDEFAALPLAYGHETAGEMLLTGIDHSQEAIDVARSRYPRADLYCHDINDLWSLQLPPQDLIISIGTLQSPGIDGKDMVMALRKRLLTPSGAMVLGFPNVRYIDGELRPGAAMKNYSESELSLLVKDLFFYRRYLQKRGFRVVLSGKYYVFLTAFP